MLSSLAYTLIGVDTACHGGVWLSSERLVQIPADQRSTDERVHTCVETLVAALAARQRDVAEHWAGAISAEEEGE